MPPTTHGTVLFDGECSFCRGTMRFIRNRDSQARFRFVALQSSEGQELLARHGLPINRLDSVVLIADGEVSMRSTAVLRICRHLSGAWPLLYAAVVVPRPFRDWLYDQVARRRRSHAVSSTR